MGKGHLVRNTRCWANENGAFGESGYLARKGLFGGITKASVDIQCTGGFANMSGGKS